MVTLDQYDPFYLKDILSPNRQQKMYRDHVEEYFKEKGFFTHQYLSNHHLYEALRKAIDNVYTRDKILFSIDVEAWEGNTDVITELGVAIYDPRGQQLALTPAIETFHIVIKENENLRNGRFVPDYKDNFNGGVSYRMPQEKAAEFVQKLVDYHFSRKDIECCLVGHDVRGDARWFASIGIHIPHSQVVDTKVIYSLSHGKKGGSLLNLLQLVRVPYAYLHNAANDAYYTLLLAMKLCDPDVRDLLQLDVLDYPNCRLEPARPQYVSNAQMRKQKTRKNTSQVIDYDDTEKLLDDLYLFQHEREPDGVPLPEELRKW